MKGALPSDTTTNPKNDAHVMYIIITIGETLCKDVFDLDEEPNERICDETANEKKLVCEVK